MDEISIKTRKPNQMRYKTCGDYFYDHGSRLLRIEICEQKNNDFEFMIGIHELIEEYITRKEGITEQNIMDFDLMFEEERKQGLHSDSDEPGDNPRSPYKDQHRFAENIERQICLRLGIDWNTYNNELICP
jgi:hypothetical protein